MRGFVKKLIQHEAKPSAVLALRQCLSVILYRSFGSEQVFLILKPPGFSVIGISVSVYIIYF